ncbi:MAG: 2-oxoisovalerate dehydrogenase [Syntrophobacteraceae bacterium]
MTTEIIFIVEESVEGGFEAKALSHSIYTEADTLEEIRSMIKDAVQCHFDEKDRPKLIRLHIVKDEVIAA